MAAALSVSRGVATIEPVNKVIVPVLLGIVVFCFYWALFLPYASEGITHMFSPSFGMFFVCCLHVSSPMAADVRLMLMQLLLHVCAVELKSLSIYLQQA